MLAKFCSRSHGQPVPGVRNCAMMSSRALMSREGGMDTVSQGQVCMPQDVGAAQQNEVETAQFPPIGAGSEGCYPQRHERSISIQNRLGAVFRRTGFRDLSGLGAG